MRLCLWPPGLFSGSWLWREARGGQQLTRCQDPPCTGLYSGAVPAGLRPPVWVQGWGQVERT